MKLKFRLIFVGVSCVLLSLLSVVAISGVAPAHNPSQEYLASPYYTQLSKVKLTGDEATDVLLVALSQLGYHEGNSDADLGGGNLSGNQNFAEYNRLYGVYNASIGLGYDWCCAFTTWSIHTAQVPFLSPKDVGTVRCSSLLSWSRGQGIYHASGSGYVPKSGDVIFFKSATSTSTSSHVGLVLYSDGQRVHTIEGNTREPSYIGIGQYVSRKNYALTDTYIVGYASPNYRRDPSVAIDFSQNRVGIHYIYATSLNVRSGPSASQESLGALKHGDRVLVTALSGNWGKISYQNTEGWISLNYAQYVASDLRTVTFYAEDRLLQSAQHMVGTMLTYPTPPAKEGDAAHTYRFEGWDANGDGKVDLGPGASLTVSADMTLRAVYVAEPLSYRITFLDRDGGVISQKQYPYGASVMVPTEVSDIIEGNYRYIFDGWNVAVAGTVTASAEYRANYRKELLKYTVTFVDSEGKPIQMEKMPYGSYPAAPYEVPTKVGDETWCYVFAGWSPALREVTEDVVYTPQYTQKKVDYTLTYLNSDGTVYLTQSYHYGDTVSLPTPPTKKGYLFKGWMPVTQIVSANARLTPVFEKAPETTPDPPAQTGCRAAQGGAIVLLFLLSLAAPIAVKHGWKREDS